MSYQDFVRAAAGVLAGALLAGGAIAQTQKPEPATMVDTAPADSIDLGRPTAQDIAPGQQSTIPFRFKVQDGPSGPLQIAVECADNDLVIFTGSL